MAKTLANMRTDTRRYLDEATASDWTEDDVDSEINYAYQKVVTAVIGVYENYYLTTSDFDTVADQQEYGNSDGAPTDVYKIRRVEINYDTSATNSTPQRALPMNMDELRRDLANTNIGLSVLRNPGYYTYGFGTDFKIGFTPIPDEAGTDAIKVWYIAEQADLSAAADSVSIPYADRYAYLIPLCAAAMCLRKGQQEEAVAARYLGEFEMGIDKMQAELSERHAEETKVIIDTLSADTDFSAYASGM